MSNLLVMISIASLISSSSTNDFQEILSHASPSDIAFIKENDINDWDDYEEYMNVGTGKEDKPLGKWKGGLTTNLITNVERHLNDYYSDYYWIRNDDKCGETRNVSNHIPIEMLTMYFPDTDIEIAINEANVEDKTSYGGCGPIASLGIMDYFARYLGYDEINSDPYDSTQRIKLATEVLSNTYFSILSSKEATLVWPWDNTSCFNRVMANHGLSKVISAHEQWTIWGGQQTNYWNQIVDNIDSGLPVSMFTGMFWEKHTFSQHYVNIYGYETWLGIPSDGGQKLTKTFVKTRVNGGADYACYCDAEILDRAPVGIITYDVKYANSYSFYDYDFSEEFVNDAGNGQYFFYNIDTPVSLSNGKTLQTSRLRTSYIENKYLVLSPNREGAGTAYLDITFPNPVSKLSFGASMWSGLESASQEYFKVQYYDGYWKDYISIDLSRLTSVKDYPDRFEVLFPKDTNRIRFYAYTFNPSGDRNKGRICLDNFVVEYN